MIRDQSNNYVTPTPRERELMGYIAQGLQNKNIAFELHISENTVRAHIGNIMRKYNVRNRTQVAVLFALDDIDTFKPSYKSG
jgi:DNA-binding NarL/FixJ family response regulator